MSILSVSGLAQEFADRTLFQNVAFSVEKGDKIGLIGANGAGKTTLFKILLGEILPSAGEVVRAAHLKIGYLEQHVCGSEQRTAYEETLQVFSHLQQWERELEEINAALLVQSDPSLIERQTERLECFQKEGGLTYRRRTEAVLSGLGFSKEEMNLTVSSFSGGQRSKIGLAKLLLCENDFILLDEPTNHLDIESVLWLEDFLSTYSGAVMMISHDRYFLDKVTAKTMEIENQKIYFTGGNYSRYQQLKAERKKAEQREYENKSREIKRIEGIIEQQKRWNRERNIKTAESKQKQIDRIVETMHKPEEENHRMAIDFPLKSESGNTVFTVEKDACFFGDTPLYQNASFTIQKGDKVCLIGPNGVGKTTLLKRLVSGDYPEIFRRGVGVTMGYFDQFQDRLNPAFHPLEELQHTYPTYTDTTLRNALAAFGFKGDDVFKVNARLSGGERARVALCKLVLSGDNFLVLDEPTNHLDIYSRAALEEALSHYQGTIFMVSHDRYFINSVANKIVVLTQNKTETVVGNYDDYLAYSARNVTEQEVSVLVEESPVKKGKEDYLNKKKRRSDLSKCRTALVRVETEIADLEAEGEEIRIFLQAGGSDYEELAKQTTRLQEVETELLEKMEVWESLSKQLDTLLKN